jgi:hypothetical protein
MRRTYISPEFNETPVNGTFNAQEQSNFFSSALIKIQNELSIDNIDIVWYESITGEQLQLLVEATGDPIFYSPSDDKLKNHKLYKDQNQSNSQKNSNTKWIIEVSAIEILKNYLFSTLKKSRTIEGLRNSATIYNDVDLFLKEYIEKNILDKYAFSQTVLYFREKEIIRDQTLKSENNWNTSIREQSNILKNVETVIDREKLFIIFNQRDINKYSFDYYYDLKFKRI